ncbi:hypothetical protein [Streptomyces avermitilis]|uniref:hypothetical protein n=1 Tax=Streptomyces avermitilis TaxID=33903 RepID=UPI002017F314|nr:hypothetical protein [Streptomyces avermitilis]
MAGPTATADSGSHSAPSADPAAIREWNVIATDTITASLGARPSGQAAIWHGFVSAAVYNAVVGIEGRYAPYKWHARGPSTASPEAAAVTAAHHVLLTYFPASRAPLDAAYAGSLAKIPEGQAKRQGVAFGERAAEHLIELREGTAGSHRWSSPLRPRPASGGPPRPPTCPSSTPGSAGFARCCSLPRISSGRAGRPLFPRPATPRM